MTLADVLNPLSPSAVGSFLVIGVVLGITFFTHTMLSIVQSVFRLVMAGAAFFLPYTLMRDLQGASSWGRNLGAFILWLVFCLGIFVGEYMARRYGLAGRPPSK